jgi:predicted PurR-regulated permease PerM
MRPATLFFALGTTIMVGWLLYVGRPILLPVIAAVISLYVLSAAADGLGRVPGLAMAPAWLRRALVLVAFAAAALVLSGMITSNVSSAIGSLPRYAANLEGLVTSIAEDAGLEGEPAWEGVRALVAARIDVGAIAGFLIGSLTSLGGTVFLVVLYASFLLAEGPAFEGKLAKAVAGTAERERLRGILAHANERIGHYLVVKTIVNAVLAVVSLAVMLGLGIEFAVFWAVLIGFTNYVPYIGSIVGVLFPTALALAQFGTLGPALLALLLLTGVQVFVGSVLEPRMMGRAFNLSTFVVVLSLSFWAALWGLAGAILAVPLTSIALILLAEFATTRPIAVMLSANGRV